MFLSLLPQWALAHSLHHLGTVYHQVACNSKHLFALCTDTSNGIEIPTQVKSITSWRWWYGWSALHCAINSPMTPLFLLFSLCPTSVLLVAKFYTGLAKRIFINSDFMQKSFSHFLNKLSWFLMREREFDLVLQTAGLIITFLFLLPKTALVHNLHHLGTVYNQKYFTRNLWSNTDFFAQNSRILRCLELNI